MPPLRVLTLPFLAAAAMLCASPSASTPAEKIVATGSEMTASLMARWAEAFKKTHPGMNVVFSVRPGAMPADRVGIGPDIDEIFHVDDARYIEKYVREPFRIRAALGSFDTKGKVQGIGIYVHRDNPLSRVTFAQLDAIFSSTRRRGNPRDIATWGDLGVSGEWAAQPIHVYGRKLDQEVPWFFRDLVLLGGSYKRTYQSPGKGGSVDVVDAVAADRLGITFVAFMHATPGVKALAVADRDGVFVEPTSAGVASGRYALARPVFLYTNLAAHVALDPNVRQFLEFVLSPDGQLIVAADGYFPLPPEIANVERAKLE